MESGCEGWRDWTPWLVAWRRYAIFRHSTTTTNDIESNIKGCVYNIRTKGILVVPTHEPLVDPPLYPTKTLESSPGQAARGRPWPPMAGHGRPWPPSLCRPWPPIAARDRERGRTTSATVLTCFSKDPVIHRKENCYGPQPFVWKHLEKPTKFPQWTGIPRPQGEPNIDDFQS